MLDKGARRLRTGARDDPVTGNRLLPVARFEHDLALANLDRAGLPPHENTTVGFGLLEQLDVRPLGSREIGTAVEDGDDIALRFVGGEAERVFNPGVPRSDHGDMLVDIFGGVVELVLDVRQIRARKLEQVGISLRPDRQHDRFGLDHRAVLQRQGEGSGATRYRGDIGVGAYIDLAFGDLAVPGVENCLALAGVEIEVAPQHQIAGRRHDVLALLVFEDGVRQMIGLLEQYVAHAALCRMRSRAQPGRTGPYNRNAYLIAQRNPPRRLANPLILWGRIIGK